MTAAAQPGQPWQSRAACQGNDTEHWFARGRKARPALDVCDRCPVDAECLLDALRVEAASPGGPPYGIRGGLTPRARRGLGPLPATTADALVVLGDVLAEHRHRPTERKTMTTAPSTPLAEAPALAAVPEPARTASPSESLPIGRLLAWADGHDDQEIRDQSARARLVLAALRRRYDSDKELAAITTEAEELEQRLAELQARRAVLVPAKPKKRPDPNAAAARAWAREAGVDCPPTGRVPKAVVIAWHSATGSKP